MGPGKSGPFWGPICHFLANWAPANRAPADWAPENCEERHIGPRKFVGGKLGPGKLGPGKLGPSPIWRQIGPRTFWGPICHFLANRAPADWAPWRQIGPRQIGPRQIGPLKIFVVANWAPKSAGPNLLPNWRGAQFAGAQSARAQFA